MMACSIATRPHGGRRRRARRSRRPRPAQITPRAAGRGLTEDQMSTMTPTVSDDAGAAVDSAQTIADSAATLDELDAQMIAELQAGGISLMETMEIALSSLTANKLRTLLTALGIIIGVAAVVALMAIGNGSQATDTAQITPHGADPLKGRSCAAHTRGGRGA